jgi:hypothetical protein
MKESHGKGPASHPDPESCVDGRKSGSEALTGAHAGQPSSCEIIQSGAPTLLSEAEGHTGIDATGKPISDPTQSKTLRMRGNSSHENREIPTLPVADGATGRPEKATSRTSCMHGVGKSDGCIIPQKPPNKDGPPTSAEGVEGRQPTKGNTLGISTTTPFLAIGQPWRPSDGRRFGRGCGRCVAAVSAVVFRGLSSGHSRLAASPDLRPCSRTPTTASTPSTRSKSRMR